MASTTNMCNDFVYLLASEGKVIRCDDSQDTFRNSFNIPHYANLKKIKRAQKFYSENIAAISFSQLLSLIVFLAIDELRDILVFTNQSNTAAKAYQRYTTTIRFVDHWFSLEFGKESRSWETFKRVREVHNSASKAYFKRCGKGITQENMALTQLAFVGFIITRPKLIGLHHADQTDLECFIHFWRVIGSILGIEDRFNICQENFEGTKLICEQLLHTRILPEWTNNEDFFKMSKALADGLRPIILVSDQGAYTKYGLTVLHTTIDSHSDFKKYEQSLEIHLDPWGQIIYNILKLFNYSLKSNGMKSWHNFNVRLFAHWIPFLKNNLTYFLKTEDKMYINYQFLLLCSFAILYFILYLHTNKIISVLYSKLK